MRRAAALFTCVALAESCAACSVGWRVSAACSGSGSGSRLRLRLCSMGEPDAAAMDDALRPISTAVDASLQALADVFVDTKNGPQIVIQKMQYEMEKHDSIVRSAMQASVDALVQRWLEAQDALQLSEDEQCGHLQKSLEKELARQAAARKRTEAAERLKAEEQARAMEIAMKEQAEKAEKAAQKDAFAARKELEEQMELDMDLAEHAIRMDFAAKMLDSKTMHEEAVEAAETEMEQLQNNAIEAILLGRSEEELQAAVDVLVEERQELERVLKMEREASEARQMDTVAATDESVRWTAIQADSMRADIVQAQEHFEMEERRVKGLLSTLKEGEVNAEKREFMRQLEREKRRATYLKAANSAAGKDLLAAKAAAQRRMAGVAARTALAQAQPIVAPGAAQVGGGGGGGFFPTTSGKPA